MGLLLELLIGLVLLAAAVFLLQRMAHRRRAQAELWQVRIRPLTRGTAVELVRSGDPPQRVALLDPADEDFTTKLEEARAAALERAVALNVARQGLPG
jgi:hypothetical protein